MCAGKGGEDQFPRVRMTRIELDFRHIFHEFDDLRQIREIQARFNAARHQVQRRRDEIHIACPLPVSAESAFDPFRARQNRHLRSGDRTTLIIMRMNAQRCIPHA